MIFIESFLNRQAHSVDVACACGCACSCGCASQRFCVNSLVLLLFLPLPLSVEYFVVFGFCLLCFVLLFQVSASDCFLQQQQHINVVKVTLAGMYNNFSYLTTTTTHTHSCIEYTCYSMLTIWRFFR